LRSLGITTVYVTHDQAEAMALGDRVVVMSRGAIAQIGTPRQIYFEPVNRFVAEFIGAANIIEGEARSGIITLPGGTLQLADRLVDGSVVAMIRPETFAVAAPDGASLCGQVEQINFVGNRQRVTVTGAASRTLSIDAPNTVRLAVGERIGLSTDPKMVRLLPIE